MTPSRWLAVATAAVAGVCLLPLVYLLVRAAQGGTANVIGILSEPRVTGLALRSVFLVTLVTVCSVLIAVTLAWLTARTDLPARRMWSVLAALPLVVPSYVGAYALIAAAGPRGMLQSLLAPLGVERIPEIYGLPGATIVLTLFTYPYVYLAVRSSLLSADPRLEEAAATLGKSHPRRFVSLVLPHIRPAIAAGSLLSALYTLHDFGGVSLMRYDTFTYGIYLAYQGSFDRTRAAVLSLVLICLTAGVVAAERRARRRAGEPGVSSGPKLRLVPLARWRWPAVLLCAAIASVSLVMPLGVVSYWMVKAVAAGSLVGLSGLGATGTLVAGLIGTMAAMLAAAPVALMSARYPGRLSRTAEAAVLLGQALPGLVVGLALVFFGARYLPALYQTHAMLAFAYGIMFLPLATGVLRVSLMDVSKKFEEAARTLGTSRIKTIGRVTLPMIRPGIVAAAALVFLNVMKELPATLLLAPIGFGTLATRVWSATSAALFDRAAPAALFLVLVASLPLALLLRKEKAGA